MKKLILPLFIAVTAFSFSQVPSYVPTSGLVGWWPFNGNVNDESGNNHNGVVIPGNNGSISYVVDQYGNLSSAIELTSNPSWNQLGPHIELTNTQNVLVNSEFTINYFVSMNSSNQIGEIINKGADNTPGAFVSLIVNGTLGNSITSGGSVNQANFPQNTWTMVTILKTTAGQLSLYINGIYIQSSPTTNITNTTSQFYFGAMPSGGSNGSYYPFQGKLDNVGFWNRALTECELKDLYNAQLNSSPSIQAGTDVAICEGNDVIFNGSGGSNYVWNNGVQNGVFYTPTVSQEYIVIGQDANNCYGTDTIYVELIPNTSASVTQNALDSYTWPINNQTYTQSGSYSEVISNEAGCDSTITLNLTLSFTGIEENGTSNFTVYPNPTNNLLNVMMPSGTDQNYVVFDSRGRKVLEGKLAGTETQIDLKVLTYGAYMLKIGEEIVPVRVIKQ